MSPAEAARVARPTTVERRSPDTVMTLQCMGSAHPHRLSFLRVLLRRLKREGWSFSRPVWELDTDGHGTAVYTVRGPERSYSLVAFSHHLDPEKRSDRVIATAWDATFALFDGVPEHADLERLRANVPLQEAGRVSRRELSVSRANKSVRLFEHVVERLAAGQQPDRLLVNEVGYLMRTTAVYGSGKLGASDYEDIADRPEFQAPYQAEMLSVYLIRQFTLDLVEHIARARAPLTAASLSPGIKRQFGLGNATGLGMAPYLVNHPLLLDAWVTVRETALAEVRSLAVASPGDRQLFGQLLRRARRGVDGWRTEDATQQGRIAGLALDLERLEAHVDEDGLASAQPWDSLYRWADARLSLEGRELLVSLLIECQPGLVDGLESLYRVDEADGFRIDASRSVGDLTACLDARYGWIAAFDFDDARQTARFWYTSEEKLEPRLGERWAEAGSEREQPIAIARDMQRLRRALDGRPPGEPLAAFLLAHPEHRHMVRRALLAEDHPYSEIRDNIIDAGMRPIDILRFKLAFFGATRFDPRSDRWVRITLFQHAPCMDEFADADADDWFLPSLPE